MKNKISIFGVSLLVLIFLMSAVSAVTLANWNFEDSDLVVDSGTGTLTISDSRTATYPVGNAPSAVAAMSTTGWDVADRYIELAVSTLGYEDITLKLDEQASLTGPTAFQIQYSSDGTTFTNLGSTTSTVSAFTANPMHTFDFSSITALDNNANAEFRISVPTAATSASGTLRIDNLLIEGSTYVEPDFCSYDEGVSDNPGDLYVRIKDITVTEGFGDDEEWLLLDEVEVEVEIENKGDDDVDDVSIEWGIYNVANDEWVIEIDEEDEFNLKDGDEEKLTITFRVDDDDFELDLDELGDSYTLFVRATGEVDNDTNPKTCASDSEGVTIEEESDFVILDDIKVPEVVQCGAKVQITADVWNIGEDPQDDVTIIVFNKELGINEEFMIDEIDEFDNELMDLTFEVPKNAEEKTYSLRLTVYDEDHDIYENDYDEDRSIFSVFLKVEGNCGAVGPSEVLISANLESEAKAGKDLVIKATITNNGDELETFLVNVAGISQWASSYTVDKKNIVLNAGASTDVLFTFDVNKDASGDQGFTIELLSGNNQVITQPVSVVIEARSGLFGLTGAVTSGNAYLWGIGLLNIILIIIIIFVAVRIARRK